MLATFTLTKDEGKTPLIIAAENGHAMLVAYLLNHKQTNVNIQEV